MLGSVYIRTIMYFQAQMVAYTKAVKAVATAEAVFNITIVLVMVTSSHLGQDNK